MDRHRIIPLYRKLQDKVITAEEQEELNLLMNDPHAVRALKEYWDEGWDDISPEQQEALYIENYESVFQSIVTQKQQRQIIKRRSQLRIAVAASVAVGLAIIGFLYINNPVASDKNVAEIQTNIPPGGNKATLTLADGRTIALSEDHEGIITGKEVTYNDGSSVFDQSQLASYDLQLTTPKGGHYQVTLPDGSVVWLNSQSTLRYPSRFTGATREVTITGEAYFAVTEDKSKPFVVTSKGQRVRVLGTEFNVYAFEDEAAVRTTLVKGSVQVYAGGKRLQIKPGEQAIQAGTDLTKQRVDVETEIAWKDGYFKFDGRIQRVMAQISRWYDVEVVYEKGFNPQLEIDGRISRDMHLNELLGLLEEAAGTIHFKQKGRRVEVTR